MMNPIKLTLLVLLLSTWATTQAQEVIDFRSSPCRSHNSRLFFHKKTRITSLNQHQDRITIQFNARANCSAKYKLIARTNHDALHLRLVPVPIELPQPDGTIEYHYDASMCDCWFTYTTVVKLAAPSDIQRFTLQGLPLKQCFIPSFWVPTRDFICKGRYQPTPKLLKDEYVIAKGDTLNLIDQFGARQGFHLLGYKLLLKFKDDQLQQIWRLRDDYFIASVYFYENGKVVKEKHFD